MRRNFPKTVCCLFITLFLYKYIILTNDRINTLDIDAANHKYAKKLKINAKAQKYGKTFKPDDRLINTETYSSIKCVNSKKIEVSIQLCLHDLKSDVFVSEQILAKGVWEQRTVENFVGYLKKNPDWLVLDVGAQIGQYSLFAAKMGHKVVSVEPFYDNIIRIHKAACLAKTYENIVLITNAISNKRNEFKLLNHVSNNIGGQSLIQNKDKKFEKDENNKYLVETILFDDIVPHLPITSYGQQALLKIDIEGFEPYAFENANLLFDILDIRVVFMEWFHLPKQINELNRVLAMIEFFYSRNYEPYGDDLLLQRSEWKNWTYDIVWKKK